VGALIAIALLAAGPRQHLGPPVPQSVRRVVTLAPALSEIVLALSAQERLAGVTRFDDDPRTRGIPRIGGYNDPQPEAVLAVKPDLILAEPAPENRGPVETLARLGISVETFPLSTVAHIEAAISAIAGFLAVPEKGRALTGDLERARQEARTAARERRKVRALLVFGLDPLVVAGPTGFAGELLADAGGENAAGANPLPFFRLSAEAAVRAVPEVIVLCGIDAPPGRAPIPGLEKTRVTTLRSTALLHPGPRLPEALSDLAAALYR
jgi:iron complex transport system substrate-binding protein